MVSVMRVSEQGPWGSRNEEDFFFTSFSLSGGKIRHSVGISVFHKLLSTSVCPPRPMCTCYCFSDSVSLCQMVCDSGHLSRSWFGSPCMKSTCRFMKEQTDDIVVLTNTCL